MRVGVSIGTQQVAGLASSSWVSSIWTADTFGGGWHGRLDVDWSWGSSGGGSLWLTALAKPFTSLGSDIVASAWRARQLEGMASVAVVEGASTRGFGVEAAGLVGAVKVDWSTGGGLNVDWGWWDNVVGSLSHWLDVDWSWGNGGWDNWSDWDWWWTITWSSWLYVDWSWWDNNWSDWSDWHTIADSHIVGLGWSGSSWASTSTGRDVVLVFTVGSLDVEEEVVGAAVAEGTAIGALPEGVDAGGGVSDVDTVLELLTVNLWRSFGF